MGDACCEWVCDQWDDSVSGSVSDLGLRLMASAITAIFSLSLLFFLIYRLRQRKLRSRQNHLEAEGYSQEEVMEDITGQATTFQLNTMKPHDRIMLRRPFPPSYSEAMYTTGCAGVGAAGGAGVGQLEAPPYNTIHGDPVISYPVATLGRLVLPAPGQEVAVRGLRRSQAVTAAAEETSQSPPLQAPGDGDGGDGGGGGHSDEVLTQTTV